MNNEDIRVKFTVTGFSAGSRQTTTIGTYDCITAAEERVETWQNDSNKYPYVDELKIVKHSQVTVQTSTRSSSTPSTPVDYERQGVAPKAVEVVDPKDFREMVETLRNLEDRFVGLRNDVMLDLGDVMLDLEAVQEDVDDLKDDAMATESEICALDDELADHRNQLYALRFTVDALECELESE
jgi:hypothetical protein